MKELLKLLFIILFAELSIAGEYCGSLYEYCTHYCCGSYPNEYCCTTNIPLIIGIVIGSVIGGAILISFIVCIVCVCIKKKGKTGRVIGPGEQNVGIALHTFPTSGTYPTQTQYQNSSYTTMYNSVPAPPVYGQPGYNPPAYTSVPSAPVYQADGSSWTTTSSSQYGTQLPPLPQGLQSHNNNMQNT